MECAPIRAQAWLDEHEGDLHGLGADDAVALIENAGLHARVVPSTGGWLTQEQRSDRLTLRLAESGTVASVDAG